jgi:hypothetical protein
LAFALVVAHAGNQRYALLYAAENVTLKHCGAGNF